MSDKRLIVVVGPTGSGKTDLSIRLALNYDAPILSTDSRQVYRGHAYRHGPACARTVADS